MTETDFQSSKSEKMNGFSTGMLMRDKLIWVQFTHDIKMTSSVKMNEIRSKKMYMYMALWCW